MRPRRSISSPGWSRTPRWKNSFAREIADAQARYELRKTYDTDTKEVVEFADADYAAGSWSKERRVIARIIVGPLGVDVRYIVTSFLVATAKYLYTTIYCGRGEAELYISASGAPC